ncbi:MAG: DUF6703 family protein [Propionibacteriaceae bacterium]
MSSAPTSQPGSLRTRIERTSRPLLVRLHALPRLLTPAATLVLIALGAFASVPIALAAFVVLFLFIAWIAYLSWPVVPTSGRLLRAAMLVLIIVLAVLRFQTD